MKTSIATRLYALILACPALLSLPACTDLAEEPVSSFTPDRFFKTEAEIVAGLAAVYATLRNTEWGYYNLSQVTSDEHIVPTRGQDWYDNGRWLELEKHQWTPNSPGALDDVNAAWTDAFGGVVRANTLLQYLADAPVVDSIRAQYEAEAKVLRAFYYYQLLDLFGGVPIVTDIELKTRPKATRSAVFTFIETELKAARTALPKTRSAGEHGRITRGVADAILANMYLNAGVFSKDAGVSATSYNSCATATFSGVSACQLAVNFADSVLNSGAYTLATDWHKNFTVDNETSPELIFVVKHLNRPGIGLNFLYRALHYNQLSPTPWNGFATIAEVYNAFDAADKRREIFLVGPQINFDDGKPAKHRNGEPLVFTVDIGNETAADEDEGARIVKWPRDPGHVNEEHGNDFAYFRLAEIYLIKAEALLEMGDQAGALTLLNALRARVFPTPKPRVLPVTRDVILEERLFELTAEAKRRQDLIRHGKYTAAYRFKTTITPAHKILMPIPQSQIDANPQLTQNPGY